MMIAQIYVGTYAKYNNGSLAGKWMTLNNYDDREGFYTACLELHSDEDDPELMFQDWEDIPDDYINESHISDKFWELMDLIESSHLSAEAYCAGLDLGIELDDIEDRYQGQWGSDREFAENFFDEIYLPNVPEFMQLYIDYDAFARDLMVDYIEFDGHYFRNQE